MTKELENHHIPYNYYIMFYKIFGDYNDLDLIKYLLENILDIKIDKIEIMNEKLIPLNMILKMFFSIVLIQLTKFLIIQIQPFIS